MDGGGLDALPRARRQSAPARHPPPAPRRAAADGRRPRCLRRHSASAEAGAGIRGGAALPAAQLALAVAPRTRPRARARGERAQAVLERDEQAAPRTGARRARLGGAAVAGRTGQPRGWIVAAGLALLSGIVDLRRDQRDP